MKIKFTRTVSSRRRLARLDKIREVADPIKDALLLEIMELYDSAMEQLDRVATLHTNTVNVGSASALGQMKIPALSDEQFREEVARTLEL